MIALYITEAAFNVDRYEMQRLTNSSEPSSSSSDSRFTSSGFESALTTLEAAAPALTLAVQLKGPPLPPLLLSQKKSNPQKKRSPPIHRGRAFCSQ